MQETETRFTQCFFSLVHYLQIILSVYSESVTKHVPHDQHVALLVVNTEAVHAQELGQEGTPMTFHNVLKENGDKNIVKYCANSQGA